MKYIALLFVHCKVSFKIDVLINISLLICVSQVPHQYKEKLGGGEGESIKRETPSAINEGNYGTHRFLLRTCCLKNLKLEFHSVVKQKGFAINQRKRPSGLRSRTYSKIRDRGQGHIQSHELILHQYLSGWRELHQLQSLSSSSTYPSQWSIS